MGRFEWYQFPEGRIRFSGGTRGNDETGYETFEVELPSGRYFGELGKQYPDPKGEGFYLTVPAFGARREDNVGGLVGVVPIRQSELDLVVKLLPQLAHATVPLDLKQKSSVMRGEYLGRVIFEPGWAKLRDE